MAPAKFSIFMPTRNRPRFLRRAVEAILDQEYTNFELIIKDGSDDRVQDLPRDDRIIYVHSRDRNITHALNMATSLASGNICHWANDDDVMEPGALGHVASLFTPDVNWLYAIAEVVDLAGTAQFRIGGEAWDMKRQLERNLCPQPTVYWRRSLAEYCGPFDELVDLASDYDMWVRFGQWAPPLVDDTVLARYTLHDGSISVKSIDAQNADAVRVREKWSGLC